MLSTGVDVAKETYDVQLISQSGELLKKGHFANKASGHRKLVKWMEKWGKGEEMHICMEATSIYWEELAETLHQAGYQVSVVNPSRIKGYALSQMKRSKTDPLDAEVIADFCRTQSPEPWSPPSQAQKKFRALNRHLQTLKKTRTQHLNRLKTCRDAEIRTYLQGLIEFVNTQIKQVQQRIEAFLDEHPDLKKNATY